MNAASQILRVLAIIGALAAGTFFFLTKGKIEDLNTQLTSANNTLATTKTSDAADLAVTKTRAEKAEADKASVDKKLADALKSNADVNDLLAQATAAQLDAEKKRKAADAALADKQSQIDDLKKQVDADAGLATENTGLKAQVDALQKQIDDLKKNGVSATSETAGNTSPGGASTHTSVAAGPIEPATIGAVNISAGLVEIEADVPKDTAVMLEAGGAELGRGTVIDSQSGHSVVRIDSTGELTVSNFFKIVVQGLKIDYVRLK